MSNTIIVLIQQTAGHVTHSKNIVELFAFKSQTDSKQAGYEEVR